MLNINGRRLKDQLLELAALAETPDGIQRLSYSNAFWRSCSFVSDLMCAAGMAVRTNTVGNVVGTYPGRTGRKLVAGSHIDSVPNGGRFDGCLGVLAAIEAVRTLAEHGVTLNHSVDVAAWAEEEGVVIGGLLGSRAYCGLPLSSVQQNRLGEFGIAEADVLDCRAEGPLDYALELHIEQGGILERQQKKIGAVTSIVAIRRYLIRIEGTANHAGTTPMDARNDALVTASRFIQRVSQVVMEVDPFMVGTVGYLEVEPNTINVIPGRVTLSLELRAASETLLERAYRILMDEFADQIAEVALTMAQGAYQMDETVRCAIHQACDALGLPAYDMVSGAGQDSMCLAQVTRAGMIFVPSMGGVSHSPLERTEWEDAINGANVLLNTLVTLDGV